MKIKSSLYLICFIFACIILQIGCEKKDEINPNSNFDSYISITPVLNSSVDNVPIAIYSEDTLRYNIYVYPKSRLAEVNLYIMNTVTGFKKLLIDSIIPNSIASGPFSVRFNCPVDFASQYLPFAFSIEVKETNDAPATYMSFGKCDSLSTIKSYSNLELFSSSCLMYDTVTQGIKISSNYTEWRNYSILLPFLQLDSVTSGISTVSYKATNDTNLAKYKNLAYFTKFKIIGSDTIDFDKILTPTQIANIYTKSTDTVRVFKKEFPSGLIAAQIYSTNQDTSAAHKGIYTYALIKINSNIPKGSLKADVKTYNPYRFY